MSQSHFTPLPYPREIKVSPRPLRGGILSGTATLFSFSVAIPGFTPQRGGRGGDRTGDDLHGIEPELETVKAFKATRPPLLERKREIGRAMAKGRMEKGRPKALEAPVNLPEDAKERL
jgi:hypothetical protein